MLLEVSFRGVDQPISAFQRVDSLEVGIGRVIECFHPHRTISRISWHSKLSSVSLIALLWLTDSVLDYESSL